VHLGLLPDERLSGFVIAVDEGFDVSRELCDGAEGSTRQRLSGEDREPDFHLIEPRRLRGREVEMNVGVAFEPTVILWLVGVEIVEDDMDLPARMFGDDPVHEVEELDPPPPFIVPPQDFAARHIEGRKKRGGPAD